MKRKTPGQRRVQKQRELERSMKETRRKETRRDTKEREALHEGRAEGKVPLELLKEGAGSALHSSGRNVRGEGGEGSAQGECPGGLSHVTIVYNMVHIQALPMLNTHERTWPILPRQFMCS